jgi:hypothetical protein
LQPVRTRFGFDDTIHMPRGAIVRSRPFGVSAADGSEYWRGVEQPATGSLAIRETKEASGLFNAAHLVTRGGAAR